ncbi:MAG: tetratricopeptide repeat protein [Bergeyella sp.]
MKRFLSLLVIFQSILLFYAQNPKEYSLIYTKTYLETSQKDFNRALKVADSLFKTSRTPEYQSKSLMLSASLCQQAGDMKNAVDYAVKAEQVIKNTDDYAWQARIYGFLSTQYRQLGLSNQSAKYINKTETAVSRISDEKIRNQVIGFVMQEKAYNETEKKQYAKSIEFVNKAQEYFKKSGLENDFLTANNEQLIGLNYYRLQEYDKALEYYNKAHEKLKNQPDNHIKALVYNGLTQVYIEKNNRQEAGKNLAVAEKYADESPYLYLKKEIYATSQEYYSFVGDLENLKKSKAKYDSVSDKISTMSTTFINDSYTQLEKKNEEIRKGVTMKNVLLLVSVILIVLGIVYFVYQKRKNVSKESISKNRKTVSEDESAKKNRVQREGSLPIMTHETEEKILVKLEKFEQSALFRRNTVSLSYLANYCLTNTKYLSYVIKKHKQKDFNNYINELRIKYIVDKLKTDSEYRKYKISTLAEEAGFSSQSKFAAAFKKVNDVSPSQFLQEMEQ